MLTALADGPAIDTGNTAWLLVSTALVLLMTPGLAFFYGGLNRSKSVLNMMMMSFSLYRAHLGSVARSTASASRSAPNSSSGCEQHHRQLDPVPRLEELRRPRSGRSGRSRRSPIPTYVVLAFQMMFAIITVALISGSISDRTKFAGWLRLRVRLVHARLRPGRALVWGGGFIGAKLGALDFAGGTAVHINAGSAALALAIVLGRRVGWPRESFKPHNVPFVALGAGLLWFGWFGFNAGSELTADGITAIAFVNTQVATAAALLGWIIVEWIRNGKPTLVGASSGAVAGLVAITPACALHLAARRRSLLGLVAGAVCALAVSLKYRLGFDDSLDVFGVHFVGGWIGSCRSACSAPTGVQRPASRTRVCSTAAASTSSVAQAVCSGIVTVWSFGVALVIGWIIEKTIGFRASSRGRGRRHRRRRARGERVRAVIRSRVAAARSRWPESDRRPVRPRSRPPPRLRSARRFRASDRPGILT